MARGIEYKTREQMRMMARAGVVVADALAAAREATVQVLQQLTSMLRRTASLTRQGQSPTSLAITAIQQ